MGFFQTRLRWNDLLPSRCGRRRWLALRRFGRDRGRQAGALAWRVLARRRGSDNDDPTIIRHLHDPATLKPTISASENFKSLLQKATADDAGRGGPLLTGCPERREHQLMPPLCSRVCCNGWKQIRSGRPNIPRRDPPATRSPAAAGPQANPLTL
jgi:hypothetical protein